jgi:DNA repair protein RecN (Recombination protein N)
MLKALHIADFALIDELSLEFSRGFNLITGETGAGKSILIDAVDFALGGRSETTFIRSGAERARVELVFHLPQSIRSQVRAILEANDMNIDLSEALVLDREVRANGRSSSKINGLTCKQSVYREVGSVLVDIHGQTEHLSLLRPKAHIFLLDRYANCENQREELARLVRQLHGIQQTISSLQQDERQREQRIEFLKYQIQEIETARLIEGEEEALREERNLLANAEKLANLSEDAYEALEGEDVMGRSGLDALNITAKALEKLAALDNTLAEEYALAESLVAQAEELAVSLRRYKDKIEVSPNRLDHIEERLEILYRLKRKYGDSVKVILEYAERARKELNDIEMGEERLAELYQEEDKLLHSIGDLAKNLSLTRQKASEKLSQQIVRELVQLRMENARFEVSVTQEEDPQGCYVNDERLAFDSTGIDHVEFLMSANLGEPIQPLVKVASGGETARIMLALKTVLSAADETPTLIFDEIDQGIGARVGETVGQKLWGLTASHQVFCVTHLAQIASFADTHFRVTKGVKGDRTVTTVDRLDHEERIQELSDLLGSRSEATTQSAQELYHAAYLFKSEGKIHAEQPNLI